MSDRSRKIRMVTAWVLVAIMAYVAVTAPANPLGAAFLALAFARFFWREYRVSEEETSWTSYIAECVLGFLGIMFW